MVDFKHVFHRGNAGLALIRREATVLLKWIMGILMVHDGIYVGR